MPSAPNPAGLSPIVAGAWRLADWGWTAPERLAWIEANLDLGVSSIDHADSYGADGQVERLLGEALALAPALRQRLQLVGTCHLPQDGPAQQIGPRLQAALARSLQHLHTDHLDLLLLHCPAVAASTSPAPDWVQALAHACHSVQRAGQVRCFGLSQGSMALEAGLLHHLPLAAHQVAFSLLAQEPAHDGTLARCQALGLRALAWAPLAGGRLFTGPDLAALRARTALQALANTLGVSPTTLAIAWVAQHPSRPLPLLGSRRSVVVREALAGLSLRLTPAQWAGLAAAATGGGNDTRTDTAA